MKKISLFMIILLLSISFSLFGQYTAEHGRWTVKWDEESNGDIEIWFEIESTNWIKTTSLFPYGIIGESKSIFSIDIIYVNNKEGNGGNLQLLTNEMHDLRQVPVQIEFDDVVVYQEYWDYEQVGYRGDICKGTPENQKEGENIITKLANGEVEVVTLTYQMGPDTPISVAIFEVGSFSDVFDEYRDLIKWYR